MSKREKIILIIMGLTVLIGGYIFLFTGSSETGRIDPEKKLKELNRFMSDVAKSLSRKDLSGKETYVLDRASAKWSRDPFLQKTVSPESRKDIEIETSAIAKSFSYSGYLEMGDRKLAVINGMEYEIGEEFGKAGYVVKGISPTRVVIGPPGGNVEIILSLEETEGIEGLRN
jgi:hypothetical protein